SELDIEPSDLAHAIHWVGRYGSALKDLRELSEIFLAELMEEIFFVGEIGVDGGGRVFDLFRQFAHGDAFIAFRRKKLPGGIKDLFAGLRLLAGAAFEHSHKRCSFV